MPTYREKLAVVHRHAWAGVARKGVTHKLDFGLAAEAAQMPGKIPEDILSELNDSVSSLPLTKKTQEAGNARPGCN